MSLEEAFAKVVGRQASEQERERLYRLRDALGLHDNEAFWSIVMALERYDSFFWQCRVQLAEQMGRCIENARVAFAVAADDEAAHVQRVLSEEVAGGQLDLGSSGRRTRTVGLRAMRSSAGLSSPTASAGLFSPRRDVGLTVLEPRVAL